MAREEIEFASGSDTCAAWLYRPSAAGPVPCVVMAHGFSLTRHDGLPAYAEALADAGLAVLVFDHRYLGDSGGEPRQRFRKGAQLEDWRNAIAHARSLDGIDPGAIVLWGFSFSGGHVATIAARDGAVAATLALCPLVNGLPRVLSAKPRDVAWLLPRAVADLAGRHNTIPVTAQPGSHGAMTLPGEADGFARAVPDGSPWGDEISPGVFAAIAFHRPLARAKRIGAPLWVGIGGRDISVDRRSAEKIAERAPKGESHLYPEWDHFDVLLGDAAAQIAADQIEFLRRAGLVAQK
jgi:dienelactone hydrolase